MYYYLKILLVIFGTALSQSLFTKPFHISGESSDGSKSLSGEIAIHFPVGQSRLLTDFSGNTNSLVLLDRLMNDRSFYFDIDSIIISGYASPEGSILTNSRLSFERARAVRDYIAYNYPHISSNKIFAVGKLVDMQAVSQIVDNDLSMPFRNEAKNILARGDLSDIDRLSLLKDIGGGAVIQHITNYYAASLRSATGIMFYRASDRVVVDTVVIKQPGDTIVINNPADTIIIKETVENNSFGLVRKPVFALKTNVLFDIATIVNFEIEVPIGERLSLAGELVTPWWLNENKQYAMQFFNVNLEARLWLGARTDREHLTGWFTGLYAGGGYYDIEWGSKGYQGDFKISTGLTAGFAHTIGKTGNIRMEYSLGAGYFKTNYSQYRPILGLDEEWHLVRQQSGAYSWFGPTRLKVSLVWLLHRNTLKQVL